MRVFIVILMILGSSLAGRLVSLDEAEKLLVKYFRNQVTESERETVQDLIEILHRPEYVSVRSLEQSTDTRVTLECIVCRSAFAVIFENVQEGQTDDQISDVVITLCTSLGIQNLNVCSGAVALNIPIISYIIKTTPEATPGTFCGLVLQQVGNSNVCPITDSRFEWEVELPEKSVTRGEQAVPKSDDRPLTAVVLTDAHIDPLYEAFGVGDCDEPTCCRVGQQPANDYVYKSNVEESLINESLVNSDGAVLLDLDVAGKIRRVKASSRTRFARQTEPAGYWGDYRNCDTPIWAYDDAIDRIAETHKDIDVIYYIGDSIDHGVWETSYELINNVNRYIVDKMRKSFGDVPIVPVIGNHESQPTNQFAPSRVTGAKLNTTWLYDALVDKWGSYLADDAKATLRDRGDFSLILRPGLRVISINNNVAYKYNWWLVYDPLDAKNHLDWLVDQLYEAEQAGEHVHLLLHIPPGVHDLTYTWTREYNKIVDRFSDTIKAEFNGHTHSDEFKVFYSADGTPNHVAWGAGSTTSYTFYNLNYKITTFDPQTFTPMNIVNYAYNLTEANLTPNRRPHWFQLYDMKNTFGLTDLSASSIDNLVNRMVTSDKHLLDMYAAFYSKLSDARWPGCNDNCKLDNLCKTVVTVLWQRERCEQLRTLFYS